MWEGYEAALKKDRKGVEEVLSWVKAFPADPGRANMSPNLKHELAWIIERESRWNPAAQNDTSKATGLIQFMPATAKSMWNLNVDSFKSMDLHQQAFYVGDYFKRVLGQVGPVKRPGDLYLATFLPAVFHKSDDHVIGDKDSEGMALKIWQQNPGLRCYPDGPITVGCVRKWGTPTSLPPSSVKQVPWPDGPGKDPPKDQPPKDQPSAKDPPYQDGPGQDQPAAKKGGKGGIILAGAMLFGVGFLATRR
jgi:hypothetical protein